MDPESFNRESVARQLVQKHERALNVVQEEFDKYSVLEKELESASEKYKKDRDTLNQRVQELKEDRKKYYIESKTLRKEFMTKMGKKKEMSEIPLEVMILTKQIDHLEWELQTEALSMDVEKKMVKQIQDNLEKLHHYAEMYQEHEEVSKAVKNLASKLNQRLRLTQRKHLEMLESVNISDDRHKKFVDAIMKLRDSRAKRVGFQRDLEKHIKGIEHWNKVAEAEARKQKKLKSHVKPLEKPNKEKQENVTKLKGTGQNQEPRDQTSSNNQNNTTTKAHGGDAHGQ